MPLPTNRSPRSSVQGCATRASQTRTRLAVLTILVCLILTPLLQAADGPRDAAPKPPVETTLSWTGDPGPGQTVTLTARITPDVQVSGLEVGWVMPDGVTLHGPDSEVLDGVAAGQTITRQCQVTFNRPGEFQVAVGARMEDPTVPAVYASADVVFFTIREGAASTVSRRLPRVPTRELIDTPEARILVSAEPASPDGGYWVRGRVTYQDTPITGSGAGAPVTVPARQVKVEIWEDDPLFDDHDGTTRADDNGNFEFKVKNNDDGWFGGDKETYLKIFPNTPGGYVTDISWIDDEYSFQTGNKKGGSDIDFGTLSSTRLNPMFNIADVLLTGRQYASQYRDAPRQVQARYEPGKGQDTTCYSTSPFHQYINIQDIASDPDPWDDTVILHEYGHFIADAYACDESEGGSHDAYKHYSKKLAMSEGWAHYFSSAVRGSGLYFDIVGSGWVSTFDWENWTVTGSRNEGAVAATLWDLHDPANETHDRLGLGGDEVWKTFDNGMHGAERCTIFKFWDEWNEAGYPDDSELAAIFGHHGTAGQEPVLASAQAGAPASPARDSLISAGIASAEQTAEDQVPWDVVLFLVDATNSMGGEISAVRQVIADKVNELDAEDNPYQYVVETFQDNGTNTAVVDHHFPDIIAPPVAGITTGGGGDAAEDSFAALARGTVDRIGADAWLFTDAPPKYYVSGAELEGLLQGREVQPFFFIFGDCSGSNLASVETPDAAQPSRQVLPSLPHTPLFAPEGLEECIEPYLSVANAAGGQFLFIDASQIDDAVEIVRAFLNNNAGAGRYSDYVSTYWSYTWDDTTYDWYDATGSVPNYMFGCYGQSLPKDFTFYGADYGSLTYCEPGYVTFGIPANVNLNTSIPTEWLPNQAIYAFWDALEVPEPPVLAGIQAADAGVYCEHDTTNDRYVVEYYAANHTGAMADIETFEILLDYTTDEIILQYHTVADDSSCTVGVEHGPLVGATQVAYNQAGTLYAGRAIKFTPQPPQPTRDHEVLVDSTMDGVLFLLNGYSGDVNLDLYDPDGLPVDGNDANVTYLSVGDVEYYNVLNPKTGTWVAQASGDGTYFFTSAASSPLSADYEGDPTLTPGVTSPINVNLGMPVGSASFSLVQANGSPYADLALYDDGAHGDGAAGDGRFGGTFTPPAANNLQSGSAFPATGSFYLRVDGLLPEVAGEPSIEHFRRTELVPIRIQQMSLQEPTPSGQYAAPGDTVIHTFHLGNHSSSAQTFDLDVQSSQGWASVASGITLQPGESADVDVTVVVPLFAPNVVDLATLTAQAGTMAASASVATIIRGQPNGIDLAAYPDRIPPKGGQTTIIAQVEDSRRWSVADGTQVSFETSLGSVDPPSGLTVDGLVSTTLTSGAASGIAEVQATAGEVTKLITVEISIAPAYTLTLQSSAASVPPDGVSTARLTAHVYDKLGQDAPDGSTIVFGVEGDEGILGTIEGGEVYTTTTNDGRATATFRAGTVKGEATVRAGIVLDAGPGEDEEIRWTTTTIELIARIYLPVVIEND
jgi:hypothetical protein